MVNGSTPELTKERQRAKQLLAQQEILFPKLFISLKSSLKLLVDFRFEQCSHDPQISITSEGDESETDEETCPKNEWISRLEIGNEWMILYLGALDFIYC